MTVLLVDRVHAAAPWTAERGLATSVATAAKGVAILVSFVVNFSITHFVVFRAKPDEAGQPR